MAKARFLLPFLPTLVGCATTSPSDVGQVRAVAPGTYAIGVASNTSLKKTLFQSREGTEEAVSQAGQNPCGDICSQSRPPASSRRC